MRQWDFGLVLAVSVGMTLLGGCGRGGLDGPTGTVSGKITLKGAPLGDASVMFFGENNGDTATGVLQSDGTYSLKYGTGFSVPAGDYRVAIVAGPPPGVASTNPADLMKTIKPPASAKSLIPQKYNDPKTSTLIAVVKEGSNPDISFELK